MSTRLLVHLGETGLSAHDAGHGDADVALEAGHDVEVKRQEAPPAAAHRKSNKPKI